MDMVIMIICILVFCLRDRLVLVSSFGIIHILHFQVCGTDEQEEFLQECEDAVSKIQDWKSHILRTIHQDAYRIDRLQNLGNNEALVVMDWAMKYLPNFYREKQSDWFAQKGMNWHSSVCIFRGSDNSLKVYCTKLLDISTF